MNKPTMSEYWMEKYLKQFQPDKLISEHEAARILRCSPDMVANAECLGLVAVSIKNRRGEYRLRDVLKLARLLWSKYTEDLTSGT